MNKNIEILKYSNPNIVTKNAKKLFGDNVIIALSTRKNKKYMILDPNTNKFIHFGQMRYQDYTKHQDKLRRNRFRQRNKHWDFTYVYSPAYLSYVLLW